MILNKRGMNISLVIMFLIVLTLIGVCITYFVIFDKKLVTSFRTSDEIDNVYSRADILNFYIEEIFSSSSKELNNNFDENEFINNFLGKLKDYENFSEDIKQVREQIKKDNIEFDDREFKLKLNLTLSGVNEVKGISVRYNYLKDFKKEI